MCDLFGLTCNRKDRAERSLPIFAEKGKLNVHGWGIAYYDEEGRAIIKKKAEIAKTSMLFEKTVEEARSTVIIAHLRLATSGEICDKNCQPFRYRYLERDWCFVHNGHIDISYHSEVEGDSDSARAFTYMMHKIREYRSRGRIRGLYPAVQYATKSLLEEYDGTLNYLLSDGTVLYVFNHSCGKPMYFLRREKDYGGAILISTQKLTGEEWIELPRDRLLVLSRGEILVLSTEKAVSG